MKTLTTQARILNGRIFVYQKIYFNFKQGFSYMLAFRLFSRDPGGQCPLKTMPQQIQAHKAQTRSPVFLLLSSREANKKSTDLKWFCQPQQKISTVE